MEPRRFFVFIVLSTLICYGWFNFAVPIFFPPVKPAIKAAKVEDESDSAAEKPAEGEVKPVLEIPDHPAESVWIGPQKDEADPARLDEYFLAAHLKAEGASIEFIELTDIQRYPEFGNRHHRLHLVGAEERDQRPLAARTTPRRTFGMRVPVIDKLLKDLPLDRINWKVTEKTFDSVTFTLRSPDGVWEVSKKFAVTKLTPEQVKQPGIRDSLADGYKLTLTVTLKNLSERARDIDYTLQGPTGVPLEDADNAYKYRDIRTGFLRDDGVTVDESKLAASEVVKKEKSDTQVLWKRPIKYIGVDVAYFAALVLPVQDQLKDRTIASATPVVSHENKAYSGYSDISMDLTSKTVTVAPESSVQHEYVLFAGPKRQQLLQQVYAAAVLDYGWFDSICRGMVWILNLFHSLGLSYGLAIICLTVVVRTMLIPLSKHQAAHSAKMKELQPKIQARQKELEARHGKNTKEYIEASQELVAEQSKMMLGGCLPMLLQLPIFIALYRALSSSIELRMEPFLWFENLASPDAMFSIPKIPLLGWTEFNLLPCISIALMMVHQKLTMPPAQNEEQKAQYKMMNIMMFVMGATFYRVPAGLCLYFIATNVWSMTERSYFEKKAKALAANPPPPPPPPSTTSAAAAPPKKPSPWVEWWQQLQAAADKNTSIRNEDRNGDGSRGGDSKGKGGKGKKPKR